MGEARMKRASIAPLYLDSADWIAIARSLTLARITGRECRRPTPVSSFDHHYGNPIGP